MQASKSIISTTINEIISCPFGCFDFPGHQPCWDFWRYCNWLLVSFQHWALLCFASTFVIVVCRFGIEWFLDFCFVLSICSMRRFWRLTLIFICCVGMSNARQRACKRSLLFRNDILTIELRKLLSPFNGLVNILKAFKRTMALGKFSF